MEKVRKYVVHVDTFWPVFQYWICRKSPHNRRYPQRRKKTEAEERKRKRKKKIVILVLSACVCKKNLSFLPARSKTFSDRERSSLYSVLLKKTTSTTPSKGEALFLNSSPLRLWLLRAMPPLRGQGSIPLVTALLSRLFISSVVSRQVVAPDRGFLLRMQVNIKSFKSGLKMEEKSLKPRTCSCSGLLGHLFMTREKESRLF